MAHPIRRALRAVDILMVPATARVVQTPSRSWSSVSFSILMPYGYRR